MRLIAIFTAMCIALSFSTSVEAKRIGGFRSSGISKMSIFKSSKPKYKISAPTKSTTNKNLTTNSTNPVTNPALNPALNSSKTTTTTNNYYKNRDEDEDNTIRDMTLSIGTGIAGGMIVNSLINDNKSIEEVVIKEEPVEQSEPGQKSNSTFYNY